MPITFNVPEPLRRYSDGLDRLELEGATVGEVLESLFARLPALRSRVLNARNEIHPYLFLLRGSEEVPRDAFSELPVEDGSVLDLVPAVEGGGGSRDVRMRGFAERTPVELAAELAVADLAPRSTAVPCDATAGRVLADPVVSSVGVPPFDRSAMDGYAVHAEDTFSATGYDPIPLRVVGESMPGASAGVVVGRGEACRIMTGARMPAGADAVVMAEDTREDGAAGIRVTAAVTPGKNVGRRGEDIACGEQVLPAGRRLRPQDVGLLCSIGHARVEVVRRPRVRVIATGNELLAPGERPREGFIVDSNTPMLRALVRRDGGEVTAVHRLPDDREAIEKALAGAESDVLLCAGGSSVGREDFLPVILRERGELLVHGVAMRPSAPAGIGQLGGARVFLLPGNPVSCLCAYDFFAGPAIRRLAGLPLAWPYPKQRLPLARRISSQVGRVDYVRVVIDDGGVVPLALRGASLLSSTTRADGFCVVGADSEGLAEGAMVTVHLYDS